MNGELIIYTKWYDFLINNDNIKLFTNSKIINFLINISTGEQGYFSPLKINKLLGDDNISGVFSSYRVNVSTRDDVKCNWCHHNR